MSGDLARAHRVAADALARTDAGDPWSARFRVELGKVALNQGRSDEVVALLGPALAPTATEEVVLRRHTLLSLALARVGDRAGAERELGDAQAMVASGKGGMLGSEVAGACGSLHLEQGRLPEAREDFRQALEVARSHHDQFLAAEMMLNLGVIALDEEHFEEALSEFHGAREAATASGARFLLEKITGNAGFAMYGLGDFAGAQESFRLAQGEAEVVDAPIDRIEWLNNEGMSEFRMGEPARARAAYEGSLREAEAAGIQEEMGDAHAALGLLLIDGDHAGAGQHIREFARIAKLRRNESDQVYAGLLEAMLWARTGEVDRAAASLEGLEEHGELSPSMRWQVEQEMARVSVRQGREGTAEVWFRRAIATFHRQHLAIEEVESALPFLENGTDLYSDYVQFLVDRGRTDEALTVVDQSRAESLLRGLSGRTGERGAGGTGAADRRKMAAGLHGSILVFYVLPHGSFVWLTTADRTAFFRVVGGEEIAPLIQAHRRAILASKDLLAPDADPAGSLLFAKLVAPVAPLLPPGGRVFLVGDGPLSELNFETLVNPRGTPHFWIEDVVITNVPSLRMMPSSREGDGRRGGSRRMLLMGDPQYAAGEYQALPKAAEEVRDVTRHFSPESRTVLTGVQATPGAYRAQPLEQFAYIHFVAHSTANASKPLDSSVVLSRGGDGTDQLYAREIVRGRLRAELVTISGCYSSGSRVYAGEGPVGLAWAFERAGARNVIGTLWEVNDASTPALMDQMYAGLLAGARPDEALRAAKLSLLHSPGVFRKPLYWAPFQMYSSS